MKKNLFGIFCFVLLSVLLKAQPNLLPALNTWFVPNDPSVLCTPSVYTDTSGTFSQSGYHTGDTIPEFYAADTNGIMHSISGILSCGKPAVFISGSYTCPYFRDDCLTYMPALLSQFSNQISVYIIYQCEAHPQSPDISPFSGTVWIPVQNVNAGISYPQQITYGDRKNMAKIASRNLNLNVPFLIDGQCNEWYEHFGPSPNNCYLIRPDGTVAFRQGWFGNTYSNLEEAIRNLLQYMGEPEAQINKQKNVFPVPASDLVRIETEKFQATNAELFDIAGRKVAVRTVFSEKITTVFRDEIPAGLYYCRLYDKSGASELCRIIFQ